MDWIALREAGQIDEIVATSEQQPVLIFKYSTRCSISRMAFDRLDRQWDAGRASAVKRYFLDLIAFREVSNRVAEVFGVIHESPQVLLISRGQCVVDLSHMAIDFGALQPYLSTGQEK